MEDLLADSGLEDGLSNLRRTKASAVAASPPPGLALRFAMDWFGKLNKLNEVLKPDADAAEKSVKIAIIASGTSPDWRKTNKEVVYKDFVEKEGLHKENDEHGTSSVDLILKVFDRAEIYVAKVSQDNEADQDTLNNMEKVWCPITIFLSVADRI